jgi:hypothetical protein
MGASIAKPLASGTTKRAGEELYMKCKLMLVGAASVLLVSFACGCTAEMGTDGGTSADPKTEPANDKTGTTESPLIYGNPPGYNPPGYNPFAPGLNPPGYNPPGMGLGWGYPGYGLGWGMGYPGWGTNLNGGLNAPGPF